MENEMAHMQNFTIIAGGVVYQASPEGERFGRQGWLWPIEGFNKV
jgi:hypothetical protein